jgi:hypothetical protein
MQTIFCTECGAKMTYSGPKPKFCSSCGCGIGGVGPEKSEVTSKPQQNTPPSFRNQIQAKRQGLQLSEDETDFDEVPYLTSLDYEISNAGAGNPTYNFQEILNAESQKDQGTKSARKPRRKSK